MNEVAETVRFQSGIQVSQEPVIADYAAGEIRAANETLVQRAGLQLELPIAILVEQRDNALRWYVYERTKGELLQAERQREVDEVRRELETLLQQQRAELDALQARVKGVGADGGEVPAGAAAAEHGTATTPDDGGIRLRGGDIDSEPVGVGGAAPKASVVVRAGEPNLLGEVVIADLRGRLVELESAASAAEQRNAELEQRVRELDALLKAATAEAEEIRLETLRAHAERDEAVATADDTRVSMQSELDGARDELSALQAQLDETRRDADDVRDQAQLEMMRLNEELAELRELLARTSAAESSRG